MEYHICTAWVCVGVICDGCEFFRYGRSLLGEETVVWTDETGVDVSQPWLVYVEAWYFTWVTISSTGYGDISAHNPLEYLICTICMLLASFMWAYTIGNFCSIVATSDQHAIHFHQARRERAMTSLGGGARARRPRGLVVVVV